MSWQQLLYVLVESPSADAASRLHKLDTNIFKVLALWLLAKVITKQNTKTAALEFHCLAYILCTYTNMYVNC